MAIRAEGRITRLFVMDNEFFFWLDLPADQLPGGGESYFRIDSSKPNYDALVSTVLAAAVNRYTITARTMGEIDTTKGENRHANVRYVIIDW